MLKKLIGACTVYTTLIEKTIPLPLINFLTALSAGVVENADCTSEEK